MKKSFVNFFSPDGALLRFYLFRVQGLIPRLRFRNVKAPTEGWPILFGISIPKSGTHLLNQILTGFSKVAPFVLPPQNIGMGKTLDRRQRREKFEKELKNLHPLEIAMAHAAASQENMEQISSPRFLPYFILRDPRDIVVSLSFYVAEIREEHRLHSYYSKTLNSLDERILASIQGIRSSQDSARNIGKQIEIHMGWLNHPDVHTVRFEDLIHDRINTLGGIADHFLRRVDTLPSSREQIIEQLELSINPSKSFTFRSGKTGEWKEHFTEEHKKAFKDVAGDLLIKLGYEKDNDW